MKRIFAIMAIAAIIFAMPSCDKEEHGGKDSDTTIEKPEDNTGDNTDGGNTETVPDDYEKIQINDFHTCFATNYGQFYEGQPESIDNWYLELAVETYNLETYEGTGYNIALELFSNSSNEMNLQEGTYSIEAFTKEEFSNLSMMYGFTDDDNEVYGSWLWNGFEAVAGLTSGSVEISKKSDGKYEISFNLMDDEWKVAVNGEYTGSVSIYDEREPDLTLDATKAHSKLTRKHATGIVRARK